MSVCEWIYQIVVEGSKFIILGHYFFGYEFSKKNTRYLLVLYPLLIPVVERAGSSDILYLYKNMWKFFVLMCVFKTNILEKAKSFFVMCFLVSLLDAVIGASFLAIFIIVETDIEKQMLIGTVGALFWWWLGWKAKRLQRYVQNFWKELSFKEYAILWLVLLIISVTIGGIQGNFYSAITLSEREFIFMLGIVAGVIFLLICVLFFNAQRSKSRLEEINRLNTSYMELQRKYYEESLKQYEDMRSFRHDIHNHLYVLSGLSKENKVEEVKEYIAKMAESYEKVRGIHTGNFVADCIISYAIKDLQHNESFLFQMDGHFPKQFLMEDIDFCILLSNLMDNAVEALKKTEGKKLLQIEVKRYQQWLYLTVRNSTSEGEIDFSHTSKCNGHHGYGIQNVRRVVEKYQGTVQWSAESGFVEVKVKFELKKDV